MSAYQTGEAGKRAAAEIRRTVRELGIQLKDEKESLGIIGNQMWFWEHGKTDPCCRSLYSLWLGGYDIVYIVTGVREAEP